MGLGVATPTSVSTDPPLSAVIYLSLTKVTLERPHSKALSVASSRPLNDTGIALDGLNEVIADFSLG